MLKWFAVGLGVLFIASQRAAAQSGIDPAYVDSLPQNAATPMNQANQRINSAAPKASLQDVPTEYINNLPLASGSAAGQPPLMQPNPGGGSKVQTFTSGPFAGKAIDLSTLFGGAGSFNMTPEQAAAWKAKNTYDSTTKVNATGGYGGKLIAVASPRTNTN